MSIDSQEKPASADPLALLRLLHDVAVAAAQAGTTGDALAVAQARVCDFMGWAGAHAYLLNASTGLLEPSDRWHVSAADTLQPLREATAHARFESGVGLPGRVLASGRPVCLADIAHDGSFPRADAARASGLRSAFAFPVAVHGRIAAVLEFFSTVPGEPDESLLQMMDTIGESVGRVFERIRAHEEVAESGARFEALARNANDAIVTIDEDDRILFANAATARLFGVAPDQLLEMHFSELMPERYRAQHREGLRRFVRTHERRIPWDGIELPGRHVDGHEIPLEITFGVFQREKRHFFTGFMRDVSERHRVEEERRNILERERQARQMAEDASREAEWHGRQEQALREAAAAVASGHTVEETARSIASSALHAIEADGAFVQRIEGEPKELVVSTVAGRYVPEMGARAPFDGSLTQRAILRSEPLLLVLLGEGDVRRSQELPDCSAGCSAAVIPLAVGDEADGSVVLFRQRGGRPFGDDDFARAAIFGELASLALHRIRLLEDLAHRHRELQRVMDSRALLIRGFSHDVKNPIGAADGYLQLLERDHFGAKLVSDQRSAVERARRALGSALTLIQDVLDLARAETGQLTVHPAPMDVRATVEETVQEYRAQADGAGLALLVEQPVRVPAIVSDHARVRQIIGNIVSNALKYTPPPGAVTLTIITSDDGPQPHAHGRVGIQVSDTGPGIPEEQRERLFEEFFRGNAHGSGGAGVGLAISRRLAHALGGDITVTSEPGNGSTFTLWLPCPSPDCFESRAREDIVEPK